MPHDATRRPGRKRSSLPVDAGVVAALLGLVALAVFASASLRPHDAPALELRPALLPAYLALSLLRLLAAYIFALLAALAVGHAAARSPAARRVVLPVLDVLQSVPILGFFPVAVAFFIRVTAGSALGVEAAAVFLIFTCMFWNLAFGVYESLATLPEDVGLAARQLGLRGAARWSRLVLPAVFPNLVYNSLLSWANGFYFLIASEIIAVGPARYTLPGLGSYLAQSVVVGRYDQTVAALLCLLAVTAAMHLLVWGPLETYAERFHFDESGDRPQVPRVARVLMRSQVVRGLLGRVVVPGAEAGFRLAGRTLDAIASRRGLQAAVALPPLVLAALAVRHGYHTFVDAPLSPALLALPGDLLLSLLRVGFGVGASALLAVPLAALVASRPRLRTPALAVIQVAASVPAAAFFPLIVALVARGLGLEGAALLLSLSTMFWYVLFNVMGAAATIPREMNEAARSLGLSRLGRLRHVFVPAVLPGLVTGCLTAWGAGWNAMILCEYLVVDGRTYAVRGIGASLDRATYEVADPQVVAASLALMVTLIVAVNRAFWAPLYQRVTTRYKLDA
ncbi:MAG: ABC transporter permease subunit [Vicinamibacteria bacterium]|nr:ABC transporter permease subunit [Vicinamibacteria bacterium]